MANKLPSVKPRGYWGLYKKKQREEHPEREAETLRRYRARNKDRIRQRHTQYMRDYRRRQKIKQEIGGDLNAE